MHNILIPISLWDTTHKVVQHSLRIARAFQIAEGVPVQMQLLHVVRIPPQMTRWPEELRRQRKEELTALRRNLDTRIEALSKQGLHAEGLVCESNDIAGTILEQAAATGAELIVMGAHGRSAIFGALLGDLAGDVLRRATCPVLIIPVSVSTPTDA